MQCPEGNPPPAANNMNVHAYIIETKKETVNNTECLPGRNLQEK